VARSHGASVGHPVGGSGSAVTAWMKSSVVCMGYPVPKIAKILKNMVDLTKQRAFA
jgi:hypothetical protein